MITNMLIYYRFSDEEEVGIPFEYEANASWGKAFTKKRYKQT